MDAGKDFHVRELDRRASGSAFQVILSPSNLTEPKAKILLSPERKGISLEEQKKKMAAAEERRKSREVEMLKHFAEVREHEKQVLHKATEDRNNFSKMTKENISQKMEAYKENRVAQRAVLDEKFKARDKKLEEAKKKKTQ
ncbi:unnamed protein product [Tetraodon nigroviridis]|uniref:Stathmin n=1 Tax=Tetraodon nigroviridis TaxID=99883 RepID=Q4SH33_TETNG|nr:unnamed protein product [Tetraodon nigroviridis]